MEGGKVGEDSELCDVFVFIVFPEALSSSLFCRSGSVMTVAGAPTSSQKEAPRNSSVIQLNQS